jgi:hypothetical protein
MRGLDTDEFVLTTVPGDASTLGFGLMQALTWSSSWPGASANATEKAELSRNGAHDRNEKQSDELQRHCFNDLTDASQ